MIGTQPHSIHLFGKCISDEFLRKNRDTPKIAMRKLGLNL